MLSQGKYSFSLEQVLGEFPHLSKVAVQHSLLRLVNKNKITSVHKGFYVITPPTYLTLGILPPILFVDNLMKFLQRPYYVGLLNAAALHGASHQQAQNLTIFTTSPALRDSYKKNTQIKYITVSNLLSQFTIPIKTETGYVVVSSPALTAIDLIIHEKNVGGLNRATTVLSELIEKLHPDSFSFDLLKHFPISIIQRLGYILDVLLNCTDLANKIYEICQQNRLAFYSTMLKSKKYTKGCPINPKWKISINTEIEIDDL